MTTGQGGMVTTNDAAIAEAVGALRNHGLDNTRLEPLLRRGVARLLHDYVAGV